MLCRVLFVRSFLFRFFSSCVTPTVRAQTNTKRDKEGPVVTRMSKSMRTVEQLRRAAEGGEGGSEGGKGEGWWRAERITSLCLSVYLLADLPVCLSCLSCLSVCLVAYFAVASLYARPGTCTRA